MSFATMVQPRQAQQQPQPQPQDHPYQPVMLSLRDLELCFDLLEHPIWVFNITQRSMAWANRAGVALWDAASLPELQARSFKEMSESTVTRLKDYRTNFFAKGSKVKDQWTYYPNGVAKTVQVTMSGIALEGSEGDSMMLNEGAYVLENTQESQKEGLWGVEMLRHLPISVTQFDIEGNVLYQNPEALETFGNPTSVATTTPQQPKDPQDGDDPASSSSSSSDNNAPVPDFLARFVDRPLGERVLKQVQAGQTVSVEANQFTRTGGATWSALSLRQVKDPVTSQPVILYSARDITDIRTARKETEQARIKSEFLAIMAHEIRTPLHQVTGFIDLLAQTELDLEQRSFVKLLQSSARALMVVISDVLDYTKLDAGKMELESIPFEPKVVLEASMDAVRQSFDAKKLGLQLELDPNIPFRVLGDSNRLRQILLNLLSNACKFTTKGGVAIRVQHTAHRHHQETHPDEDDPKKTGDDHNSNTHENTQYEGRLRFEVTDTGMGIRQEHLPMIFEEYQQANVSVARNFGGTGLGLSICKKLVANMGGRIGVTSRIGKGSTFWFTLPYQTPPEEEIDLSQHEGCLSSSSSSSGRSSPSEQDQEEDTKPRGLHVLVAEDNLVNQKLVASMLKRTGHTSRIVPNGQEAVDEIAKGNVHYDLILMDLQMPVMDGYQATQWLRSHGHRDIPIYALTASMQRADFEDLGFNDWIGKPIPMKTFKEKLQRLQQCQQLVQRRQQHQQEAASSSVCQTKTPPSAILLRQ